MRPNNLFWVMRTELENWRNDPFAPLPQFFNRPCGGSISVKVTIEEKPLKRRHQAQPCHAFKTTDSK